MAFSLIYLQTLSTMSLSLHWPNRYWSIFTSRRFFTIITLNSEQTLLTFPKAGALKNLVTLVFALVECTHSDTIFFTTSVCVYKMSNKTGHFQKKVKDFKRCFHLDQALQIKKHLYTYRYLSDCDTRVLSYKNPGIKR